MYHHYTVDEHTIRAIGLLSRIDKGEAKADLPLATAIVNRIASRRTLYVAVLLHDIAKGRGGDHSVIGEQIARALCPRLGLDKAETQTVAWLVRQHLLMSATAQKRDLSDPKTIQDFAEAVQSPERLRLLYLLTVVDISAVGPTTWNAWKAQLLAELFDASEEVLRLGHKQQGRRERVAAIQREVGDRLGWDPALFAAYAERLGDAYWLAEPASVLEQNARFIQGAAAGPSAVELSAQADRQATLVSIYTKDVPGLFYRIAGAIARAGGNIIDARIHTTADGMALDNVLVQDQQGGCFTEDRLIERLEKAVRAAVAGEEPAEEKADGRVLPLRRGVEAFRIEPALFVDNKASIRYTVVEVNARDRTALLSDLAKAMYDTGAAIRSAHVATYGERAVDVFYLTDRNGAKIEGPARLATLRERVLSAAEEPRKRKAAA